MVRGRPPASIDQLRLVLDKASARRSLINVAQAEAPAAVPARKAVVPSAARVTAVIVAVQRDYLAAIIPAGDRLDTNALAESVGARSARLLGPQAVREWLGIAGNAQQDDLPGRVLEWNEVPLITLLPTVIDRSVMERDFLYGGTGDPSWTLKIAPDELRRVTNAQVATIAVPGRARTSSKQT